MRALSTQAIRPIDPIRRNGSMAAAARLLDWVPSDLPCHFRRLEDALDWRGAVAMADSVQRGSSVTNGLLGGQDIFTVPGMQEKLDAQLRGLGDGFLPEYLARPHIAAKRLVEKQM